MMLGNRIITFRDFAMDYINAGMKLTPKEPIPDHFDEGDILTYKMMISFGLELMLKTYGLIILHETDVKREFKDNKEFIDFMKKNNLWGHDLNKLLKKIIEHDNDFKESHVVSTINVFDVFMKSRYPYQDGSEYILFNIDKSTIAGVEKTRSLLRGKINSYIRNNIDN
jgi:hypothetical protein